MWKSKEIMLKNKKEFFINKTFLCIFYLTYWTTQVFWGAESEFEAKIARYRIIFFRVYNRVYIENIIEKYVIIMDFKPLNSIIKSDQLYY